LIVVELSYYMVKKLEN